MKGAFHRRRQISDLLDQKIVFHTWPCNADRVALLKRVLTDVLGGNLSRQYDHRDRVHVRGRDAGDGIRDAGTRGHQRNADVTLAKVGLPFANIPRSKFDTVGELAGSLALAFSPNPSTTIKAGYRAEYTLNAFSKDEGFDQRNMLNHMPFARLEVRF